jgi:hypothetical protein
VCEEVRVTGTLRASEFSERFATFFEHSTFRLEMLDFYVAANEQEPFARFLTGKPQDLSWREPWRRMVSGAVATGKQLQRVHVVTEPLAPYVEFELTCAYPTSVAAGEDIRILPRETAGTLDLPPRDYWLLDSRLVALMEYDEDGNFVSVDLTDDEEVAHHHCHWRDVALQHATPLPSYLEQAGLEGLVAADTI